MAARAAGSVPQAAADLVVLALLPSWGMPHPGALLTALGPRRTPEQGTTALLPRLCCILFNSLGKFGLTFGEGEARESRVRGLQLGVYGNFQQEGSSGCVQCNSASTDKGMLALPSKSTDPSQPSSQEDGSRVQTHVQQSGGQEARQAGSALGSRRVLSSWGSGARRA